MDVMQIREAVIQTHASLQPLMIWGPPGLGKSSVVKQAAGILKVGFIDVRLALLEPIDMRATMHLTKAGEMRWARPWFIPEKGSGIVFLDELVNAVPSMQACASQLVLDRMVGEHKLGDGWHCVAAGNLLTNRASTHAMPTHLANRFVHLYAEASVDAWVQWALVSNIDIRVVAFIKWRSQLLHHFDPQQKVQAFPSPRSWEFVSTLLSTFKGGKVSFVLEQLIKGAVGDGAAAEFIAFLRVADKMPSIDAILLNPKTAPIPTEPAVRYAVVTTLASRATKDNMHHLATYLGRISSEANGADFTVAGIKMVLAKDESLANTKGYIELAAKHSDLMI